MVATDDSSADATAGLTTALPVWDLRAAAEPAAVDRLMINAHWLLHLRWVAVIGQLTTIAVAVGGLGVQLRLTPILSIVVFTALSNIAFALWLKFHRQRQVPHTTADLDHLVIAGILAIDLVMLTGLLYFSGGPANPFAVFFFVNLSLAAVILPARWSWGLTLLAIVGFGVLLARHIPLPDLLRVAGDGSLFPGRTYQQLGLGVALVACACVVTYFITRITRELKVREAELRDAEIRRARSERLEALATLAAGAGHELASPLSTIAVIAKDLTRHLEGTNVSPSVLEDVSLIRSELDQCRRILDGMASSAGQATGEVLKPVELAALVDEVIHGLRRRDGVRVVMADEAAGCRVVVPAAGMSHAIRGILRNALDVSAFGEPVELTATRRGRSATLVVKDRGPGMSAEVLARAGEPFFTTKEPGKGMGLGLFLARNIIERLGGRLHLDSTPGKGTTVTIELPVE